MTVDSESVRLSLQADCGQCFGLCCVALPFASSSDFALDKAAGEPCTHLHQDFRCAIHGQLRERGFPGCTVFDFPTHYYFVIAYFPEGTVTRREYPGICVD